MFLPTQPENTTKPIGYGSRSLIDAERKSETTQCKCLAILWAVLLSQTDLERTGFTIRTYRNFLERISHLRNSAGRLARWRSTRSKSYFDMVHREDIKNQAADALFCQRPLRSDNTLLVCDPPIYAGHASDNNNTNVYFFNASRDSIVRFTATVHP